MKALIVAAICALALPAHADPEGKEHPRAKRIVAEEVALAALGQAWYYRHGHDTNAGDWELPLTWGTIGKKLTGSGFRFDGDGFDTNALGHPIFGLTAYEVGRENGLGMFGSFALATLDSGLWETFGEWREYGSINDMLMTSTAGVPLGETLHQLIHHHAQAVLEVDASGGVVGARPVEALSLAGQVAATRRVAFAVALPYDSAGSRGRQIEARAELFDGRLVTTFDYRLKWERPGEMWDLAALVGIGPTYERRAQLGGAMVTMGVDAEVVSGMVRPLAFEAWRMDHPTAFVRGSLQFNQHGYYHGIGGVLAPHVEVVAGRVSAGVRVTAAAYRALEGHDRYQEMITADPRLSDTDAAVRAWAGVELGRALIRVEMIRHERSGVADAVREHTTEQTELLTAGVRL